MQYTKKFYDEILKYYKILYANAGISTNKEFVKNVRFCKHLFAMNLPNSHVRKNTRDFLVLQYLFVYIGNYAVC